jgi:hypothetical protein
MSEANIDLRTREGRATKASGTDVPKENELSSKARAEARVRQLRGNPELQGQDRDKYWAPAAPEGWTYEWKLKSVMNQDDIDRIRMNELAGWEPVPLSRHPELMPRGWKGETIEVGGLVLSERPKVFTDEARAEENRAAREAVLTKEAQMREGRGGDLGPRRVDRFSKSRGPIDVPSE